MALGIINRAFEKRSTLSNPDKYILDLFDSGMTTYTGVKVSESNAMRNSAIWACVRFLSRTVASLPLFIYERLDDKNKQRATGHSLYDILHLCVNSEGMSSYTWRETAIHHWLLWGNSYSEIEYNGAGQIIGLWPLRPDRMQVERIDGRLRYTYTRNDGQPKIYEPWQILHIPGLGFDGVKGYSVISMARQTVGLALATEQYGATLFSNGARPGGVLEHIGHLDAPAQERLKKSWQASQGGLENAHRIAILEDGMKFHELGIPPQDAQYVETRRFEIEEICRWFAVPPHIIYELMRSTNNNIEHQGIEVVIFSLRPILVAWEQLFAIKLLSEIERKKYFIEFLVDGLLRGDFLSRWSGYRIGLQTGAYSVNEVRGMENMNPIPGGDAHYIQVNMGRIGEDGSIIASNNLLLSQGKQKQDDQKDDQKEGGQDGMQGRQGERRQGERQIEERALGLVCSRTRVSNQYKPLIADAAGRIMRREINDIRAAVKRHLDERGSLAFDWWLQDFFDADHRRFVWRQMHPVILSLSQAVEADVAMELNKEPGSTLNADDFARVYTASYASRHNTTSLQKVREVINKANENKEDPKIAVEIVLVQWEENRAKTTSERESIRAVNALAVETYMHNYIQYKRWHTIGGCDICRALHGKVVHTSEPFVKAGSIIDFGEGKSFTIQKDRHHGPIHDGCKCLVFAHLKAPTGAFQF